MEYVLAGRTLQRCRTAFLEQTRDATAALLIGEGNGRFLAEFLKVNTSARVVCVDSSSRMLQLARQRASAIDCKRVRFVQANLLNISTHRIENQPNRVASTSGGVTSSESDSDALRGPFDLVVTHFFLDCFPPGELEAVVETIAGLTGPRAAWLLADFRVPESGLARIRAKVILWLAYTFFGIVTRLRARQITEPDSFLESHGFRLEKRIICEHGLLHSDLWRAG